MKLGHNEKELHTGVIHYNISLREMTMTMNDNENTLFDHKYFNNVINILNILVGLLIVLRIIKKSSIQG